jgi:L-alanine-DL-glutamate epimerase-like enolase superfamily enzyme
MADRRPDRTCDQSKKIVGLTGKITHDMSGKSEGEAMKVTALETLQLGEFPSLLWLRLFTDQGIVGTGETFFAPASVAAYLHDQVAPYLLGKDPRDVALHGYRLSNVFVGSRDSGAEVRGNSAIDLALWDILGKSVSEPAWRLLGGLTRETVPLYNTCAGYDHHRESKNHALYERNEDWSASEADAAGPYEDFLAFRFRPAELAKSLVAEGYHGLKIWPFDMAAEASNGMRLSRLDLERCLEPFARIRDAVGNAIEIMVELHGLWSVPCAIQIAEALQPFKPAWIEEPVRFNDVRGLREVAKHTPIPVAASERLATAGTFRHLIEERAASVIMVDLAWCGGLSQAKRIAELASASELPVTLHDCTGPVVFATSCALSACLPNVNYQEGVRAFFNGWYGEVVDNLPRIENGYVRPLPGAGLGIALKPEVFSRPDATIRTTRL